MANPSVQEKITVQYHHQLTDGELNGLRISELGKSISERYLFLPLTFQYYHAYHETKYTNRTFYVSCNGVPVLSFHGLTRNGQLGYFHLPAEVISAPVDASVLDKAYGRLLQELTRIISSENIREMKFAYDPYLVGAYFGEMQHKTLHTCMVDLSLSEEQIFSNIRKSYKSLVNWGKRELQIRIMTKANADAEFYELVKQFHIQVAGRKTRSDETWSKHYESICAGEAYLVAAYFRDALASVAIILHGTDEAFYGVGINDRNLMEEFPVGHFPLLSAILYAKSIGLKRFNLNEIDPAGTDEKVDNISGFKKGFSKTLIPRIHYTINFTQEASVNIV